MLGHTGLGPGVVGTLHAGTGTPSLPTFSSCGAVAPTLVSLLVSRLLRSLHASYPHPLPREVYALLRSQDTSSPPADLLPLPVTCCHRSCRCVPGGTESTWLLLVV